VVGAVGERGCLFDQPADPRGTGGQVHVAGGDQRGDGGGAGFLPALGVDRDQAGHPVPQRVDYRRPVRLVFDVFRGRLRPACGQVDYLVAGLGESPAAADLVEQVAVGADLRPHLPDNEVGVSGVLEREVPGLDDGCAGEVRQLGPAAPGVAAEQAAVGRGGSSLVQRRPRLGAYADLDRLPLFGGAAAGRFEVFARGPAERVVGAVGLRGDVDDAPQVAVFGGDESAGEVVFVPAGEDEHDGRAGREAGGQGVGPPVPAGVADRGAVGLFAVLERVVDDHRVGGAAGDAGAAAYGQDAAVVAGEGPFGGGVAVVGDREPEFGVVLDQVSDRPAVAVREALGVAGGDDAQVGVAGERPHDGFLGDPGALAFLRGQGEDQPAVGAVAGVDQFAVDEVERGGLPGAGLDGGGEVAGGGPAVGVGGEVFEDGFPGVRGGGGGHGRP